jgi:hypothetical protein
MKFTKSFILLILLLTNVVISQADKCPVFLCQNLPKGQCAQKHTDIKGSTSYNLQRCPENSDCKFTHSGSDTCSIRKDKVKQYPGSNCTVNEDCFSNNCNNLICTSINDGAVCTDHSQCNFGKGCIIIEGKKTCKDLLKENEKGCTTDYDCQRHLGCYLNTCIRYFSLDIDSDLKDLNVDREPLPISLCKAGFEFNKKCTSLKRLNINHDCTKSGQCHYELNGKETDINEFCECGYNNSNNKYCRLGSDDAVNSEFINNTLDYLQNSQYCNTLERSGQCNYYKIHTDNPVYQKAQNFTNYYKLLPDYHKFENADDCTKSVLIPEYIDSNISSSNKCPLYSCETNEGGECAISQFFKSETRNHVKLDENICPNTEFCNAGDNAWWLFTISEKPIEGSCKPISQNPTGIRYAGEKCDDYNPCYRGNCINNACQGVTVGVECADDEDCNVGLYCKEENNSLKCAPQLGSGSTCSNSYECQNNLLCLEDRCQRGYYTVKTGETLTPQEGFPMDLFCEFGTFDYKNNECSKKILLNDIDEFGFSKCDFGTQCRYNLNGKHELQPIDCQCGYNDKGQGYCKPGHNTSKKILI